MTDETTLPVPGQLFEKFDEGELRIDEVKGYKGNGIFAVVAEDGIEYEITWNDDDERWETV